MDVVFKVIPVKNWVQNRIVTFDILHQQRVAEAKRTFQVFAESVIEEGGLWNLAIGVLPENEFRRLSWRVDDQRIAVETLQEDLQNLFRIRITPTFGFHSISSLGTLPQCGGSHCEPSFAVTENYNTKLHKFSILAFAGTGALLRWTDSRKPLGSTAQLWRLAPRLKLRLCGYAIRTENHINEQPTFSMMAFSVQRSSTGRELCCQLSLSSTVDKYSTRARSGRNSIPACCKCVVHARNRFWRMAWSKYPA